MLRALGSDDEMIHIGKRTTKQTLCGKPVARRWWVEAAHTEYSMIGRLVVAQVSYVPDNYLRAGRQVFRPIQEQYFRDGYELVNAPIEAQKERRGQEVNPAATRIG